MNYGKPNSRFPSFVGTGDVSPSAFAECDFIVVTGSSQNHILPNVNMMLSVVRANCNASIVFVDYGLDDDGVALLSRAFSLIHSMHTALNSPAELYYRKFDFAHFPAWMDIMERKARGGYAWKVVSLVDVFFEWRAVVYWVDGGCVIREGISRELSWTRHHGLFSPQSAGTVGTRVHPSTREFMVKTGLLRRSVALEKGMLSGGVLMLDFANAMIRDQLVPRYLVCAYTQKCISPRETDRSNHR